jgi:NADH-quinone oxidoreductase subunit J
MAELWPFIIAGAIAVAAAVMMLLSDNAVHSALFLIVTMVSIAFLFLLLNAPFLAMIQISVYAGAIMVLFLFVIMLLGAERMTPGDPGEGNRRYRWFTPVALTLSLALLISVGLAVIQGQISAQPPAANPPRVRVVHAASDAGPVDVLADETLLASNLTFGQSTDFVEVPSGEYTVTIRPAADATQAGELGGEIVAAFTLTADTAQSVVAYGEGGQPALALVPQDLGTVEADRSSRITVFNAYVGAPAIDIVDITTGYPQENPRLIVDDLPQGGVSPAFTRVEGMQNWGYVRSDAPDVVLARARDVDLTRDRTELVVFAGERLFDGSIRPLPLTFSDEARPSFGSPRAIGYLLFTDYMLPFQLVALLLLAAMVGVIVLTQREFGKTDRKSNVRRKVSRPLTNVIAAQVGHDLGDPNAPALPANEPPAAQPERNP